MSISYTHDIDIERKRDQRLDIAHKLYEALIAQDPNRAIALCDGDGRVVARHYPTPEPDDCEVIQITSWRRRST
jgi:hypothetical protein